ncbi:hypothetical protein CDAR_401521 [Caerostris darwini]|uniref:Uncharacterized protein n=1 Tax=Caerostris darwini TaxID=1538125 RepID=A0AAV4RX80_9ARAC|nr:hypothetical protein CDAR_401521 [Caerostris darwini]
MSVAVVCSTSSAVSSGGVNERILRFVLPKLLQNFVCTHTETLFPKRKNLKSQLDLPKAALMKLQTRTRTLLQDNHPSVGLKILSLQPLRTFEACSPWRVAQEGELFIDSVLSADVPSTLPGNGWGRGECVVRKCVVLGNVQNGALH